MNIVKQLLRPRIVQRVQVDQIDFDKLLERGVLIIDVSSPKDYRLSPIPDSLNIRFSKLSKYSKELSKASRPILIVSYDGKNGNKASQYLKNIGIECYHGGKVEHIKMKLHKHFEEEKEAIMLPRILGAY